MIISRDKKLLCPPFAKMLNEFETRLSVRSLPFYLFMGLRTPEDQEEIWKQGRLTPGPLCRHKGDAAPRPIGTCPVHPLGTTVTNAHGLPTSDSFHCYGLGGDYVPDGMIEKPGIQWSWDMKIDHDKSGRSDWYEMGEIARSCGLEWGGSWKRPDFPHVQCTFGYTLTEIKEFYRMGGIKNVWAQCGGA